MVPIQQLVSPHLAMILVGVAGAVDQVVMMDR